VSSFGNLETQRLVLKRLHNTLRTTKKSFQGKPQAPAFANTAFHSIPADALGYDFPKKTRKHNFTTETSGFPTFLMLQT